MELHVRALEAEAEIWRISSRIGDTMYRTMLESAGADMEKHRIALKTRSEAVDMRHVGRDLKQGASDVQKQAFRPLDIAYVRTRKEGLAVTVIFFEQNAAESQAAASDMRRIAGQEPARAEFFRAGAEAMDKIADISEETACAAEKAAKCWEAYEKGIVAQILYGEPNGA